LMSSFATHQKIKTTFVRPLAQSLEQQHVHVWYDEFSLKLGDTLRRSIDIGLSKSRYGAVVLSHAFFAKEWPQRELDGLVAREMIGGERVILPIWHEISKEEICDYSPTLADLVAVHSSKGLDYIVQEILRVVRPVGSPLLVARDRLIEFGVKPPVVTDEWWLDVVEVSSREYPWGFIPHREHWDRWSFPLPEGNSPYERGERLAWTAMQMGWVKAAESKRLSQLTPPGSIHRFIRSQPGLAEASHEFPHFLATYAPQLTIPGFGGDFEADFNELLKASLAQYRRYHDEKSSFGTATTVTGFPPRCDEYIVLHDPNFGDYQAAHVSCQFVQGDIGGPPCKLYAIFDYAIWLLSSRSHWVPTKVREFLIRGMKDWAMWLWTELPTNDERELGIKPYPGMGALAKRLYGCKYRHPVNLGKPEKRDLLERVSVSKKLLRLPDDPEQLTRAFLDQGFIEEYLRNRAKRHGKPKRAVKTPD